MTVFYVDCEDLSCVWDTYEKAKKYLFSEAERCEWEFIEEFNCGYKELNEPWTSSCFWFRYNGKTIEVYIIAYELNSKPYIE